MADLNVFQDDKFGVVELTAAINETERQPTRIGDLGLFHEDGVNTPFIEIEKRSQKLALVPAGERGEPGSRSKHETRVKIPFKCIHLPRRDGVKADEVLGIKAFGSQTELDAASDLVNRRLGVIRRDLDVTNEWHRVGAINGQLLDADGSTVLLDLFQAFGLTKTVYNMVLGTESTKVRQKIQGAKSKAKKILGGAMVSGWRGFCSPEYYEVLVNHAAVEKAFDRYQEGAMLRNDPEDGFFFGGVFWEPYEGEVDGKPFIEAGKAKLVPEGVRDLFISRFAPADYMETVGTMGVPYYAKQRLIEFDKGVDIEAQSNPIHLCTRPDAVVELAA